MTKLAEFLAEEVAAGSFPGGAALVGSSEEILEEAFAGDAAIEPERVALDGRTLFDLASLTKPLAVSGLVRLAAAGGLSLRDGPGRYLPEWKKTRYEGVTLESLLTHTSGLPAWYPLYARGEGAATYRRTLSQLEPESAPGRTVAYSDLGFLLLGEILEVFFGAALDSSFSQLISEPSGSGARFLPEPGRPCAATEKGDRFERAMTAARGLSYARFREDVVRGEVHDGNAFRRGGVAGNAGLFGTAQDVWRLARRWLDPAARPYVADRTPEGSEARGLGWQGRRGAGSAIPEFSDAAFGHTGFTGTSVWLDPERDRVLVLLTNRIHPRVGEGSFHPVRHRFHRIGLGLV